MKNITSFLLIALGFAAGARAGVLYSNTTTDTGDTFLFSLGPYTAMGDQIQLSSSGTATNATVELYNNGSAGTFDAELDFFEVGSLVGSLLGSYTLTDNVSVGGDVMDLSFDLGAGLALPQNVIFLVSLANVTAGVDLGVDMFDGPTVGLSDNSFMIVASSGPIYSQLGTPSENVYFQLDGQADTTAPEPSSAMLLGAGLLTMGIGIRRRYFAG